MCLCKYCKHLKDGEQKGGKPRKSQRSTFLEAKGASKKVAFPFRSKKKGTF